MGTTQACLRQLTTHRCRRPHIMLACRPLYITVDCLHQRNTQVCPPPLTAGCRPLYITVDCLCQHNTQVPLLYLTVGCPEQLITLECLRHHTTRVLCPRTKRVLCHSQYTLAEAYTSPRLICLT